MNELDRQADMLRRSVFRENGIPFTSWEFLPSELKDFWRAKVTQPEIERRADELRFAFAKQVDPNGVFGPLTAWAELPESTRNLWREKARKERE